MTTSVGDRVMRRSPVVPLLVVVATIALGLPEGSVGVLWPSISADLGQPLAASGVLLYSYAGGYLAAALTHGALARRVATAGLLIGGAVLGMAAALGFAASPWFALCAVAYFTIGLAGGTMDAANNSYVALNHGHRLLSVMHGGFGIGAFLGPAIVALLLNRDVSWRWAFVGLAAYELLLLVLFVVFRSHFAGRAGSGDPGLSAIDVPMTGDSLAVPDPGAGPALEPAAHAALASPPLHRRAARPGRRLMLGLSMASFFAYTGVEVGVGFWGYSLLTDRGISEGLAGLSVSAYWLALTIGRFSIGALARRITARQVLAGAVTGGVVGTLLLWAAGMGSPPGAAVNVAAMVVIGGSLAGVFPSLVALTPDRLGTDGAASAIGWQLATASLGTSTIPAIIGVVASRVGVAAIGPALVLAALLLAAVHATASWVDLRNQRLVGLPSSSTDQP